MPALVAERQIAMYLCRELTELARAVLHNVNKYDKEKVFRAYELHPANWV